VGTPHQSDVGVEMRHAAERLEISNQLKLAAHPRGMMEVLTCCDKQHALLDHTSSQNGFQRKSELCSWFAYRLMNAAKHISSNTTTNNPSSE
jgi:hypothetical protein